MFETKPDLVYRAHAPLIKPKKGNLETCEGSQIANPANSFLVGKNKYLRVPAMKFV
jgi:hypothetical protein